MPQTPPPTRTRPATPSAAPAARAPRRRDRWKVLFVLLLLAGLVGAAVWVVLGSRLLVVRDVEVRGLSLLARKQVLDVAQVPVGTPMARLDVGAVERRIAAVREVESVKAERAWPTTLVIRVVERVPVASFARDGVYAQLDRFGVTVLTGPRKPGHLPELVVAAPGAGDPATRTALAVLRGLPDRWRARLTAVEAPGPEHVILRLEGGLAVVWGAAERGPEKIKLLEALLSTKAGKAARTVDVSAPGVVTTR
ncbi:cell division protein FtsQ/DivIB [Actinocorallia sp. A-T 12471]|uniref:cell division protein FtsQ/DivIB n=1 Tax=Actinocorallia sp. A-T 12471 TaxID=3089813 RepID=UPI0029CF5336|nr:FtsQ-type POTRA domain-containing protein [Actinocorallia sp. A-T 12471]MDX6743069.1 FtsQ-type POTRA domain-containing protein [Actinocorallia sp. A-T 12471]